MKTSDVILILDVVIGSTEAWLKAIKKLRAKLDNETKGSEG